MLSTLISSKTRIKLLLKFFLNSDTRGYLRGLETEFGESTNAIRLELNRFEEAGLLMSFNEGNKKFFQANTTHPLYNEINSIIIKHLGIDQIVEQVVQRLGSLEKAYLTGDFAGGKDSPFIDLLLVGDPDRAYLQELIQKAENLINRKIRYAVYSNEEMKTFSLNRFEVKPLLLWSNTAAQNT